MEVILKNWTELLLTQIPDNELDLFIANNEEVITTFSISDADREKIGKWCPLAFIDWVYVANETPEYLQAQTEIEINEKIKRQYDINDEIIKLWGGTILPISPKMEELRTSKITTLTAEFNTIQDDLDTNYNSTLVDDLIVSLFT